MTSPSFLLHYTSENTLLQLMIPVTCNDEGHLTVKLGIYGRYMKLFREIFNWTPNTGEVLMHLMSRAGDKAICNPGYARLAKDCRCTERAIAGAINQLKNSKWDERPCLELIDNREEFNNDFGFKSMLKDLT